MNTQTPQTNWSDVKSKIKTRWSKFNDSELDGFKDHLDTVSGQIQKTYGISKEQAEKEFSEFKKTLAPTPSATQADVPPAVQPAKTPVSSTPAQESQPAKTPSPEAKKAI